MRGNVSDTSAGSNVSTPLALASVYTSSSSTCAQEEEEEQQPLRVMMLQLAEPGALMADEEECPPVPEL